MQLVLQGGTTLQATLPAPVSAYYLPRLPTSHLHLHPRGTGSTVKWYVCFWIEGSQIYVPPRDYPAHQGILLAEVKEPPFCSTIWLHNMVMRAAGWEGKTWVLLSAPQSLHFFVKQTPDTIWKKSFSLFLICHFPFVPPCAAHTPASLRAPTWWERCAPGQWVWISSCVKRAGHSSCLWENELSAQLQYRSWELYLHSCSLIQEAMAAAVPCAYLKTIAVY